MKRTCSVCKVPKKLTEYYESKKAALGRCTTCKKCMNEASAARYELNKEEINRRKREEHRRLKIEVIAGYGGACECCGEPRWQFLTLDHREGGGTSERRNSKNRNWTSFYKRLVHSGFPKDKLRLLCWNCNSSFGLYGSCPHQQAVA